MPTALWKMDGELELAGLIDEHAEDVVLKGAVFVFGRDAAGMIFGVDGFGFFARGIGEI